MGKCGVVGRSRPAAHCCLQGLLSPGPALTGRSPGSAATWGGRASPAACLRRISVCGAMGNAAGWAADPEQRNAPHVVCPAALAQYRQQGERWGTHQAAGRGRARRAHTPSLSCRSTALHRAARAEAVGSTCAVLVTTARSMPPFSSIYQFVPGRNSLIETAAPPTTLSKPAVLTSPGNPPTSSSQSCEQREGLPLGWL